MLIEGAIHLRSRSIPLTLLHSDIVLPLHQSFIFRLKSELSKHISSITLAYLCITKAYLSIIENVCAFLARIFNLFIIKIQNLLTDIVTFLIHDLQTSAA